MDFISYNVGKKMNNAILYSDRIHLDLAKSANQLLDFYSVSLTKTWNCDLKGGYKGFYAHNTITLTPKSVNDIHKRGGTILGSSRGGHDTTKIVDSIQDRGIEPLTTCLRNPAIYQVPTTLDLVGTF